MQASSSPPPIAFLLRHRRLLLWAVLPLVLVTGVLFASIYPSWADGIAARRVVEALERRTGLEVGLLEFDLDYGRVGVQRVVLRGEGLEVALDGVEASYDDADIWSGRIDIGEVSVDKLTVVGERSGLEAVARRFLGGGKSSSTTAAAGRRRRLGLPNSVDVRSIALDVSGGEASRFESIRSQGSIRADLKSKTLSLALRDMAIVARGRSFEAASVDTTLVLDEARQLQFPVSVRLEGGNTKLSPKIAVAGVGGRVSIEDREISEISVALRGGFSGGESGTESDVWSLEGRARRDLSAGKIVLDMESFELGRMPKLLARLPLVASEKATVGGHLELEFSSGKGKLGGKFAIAGLNISHPLLAKDVVEDVGFQLLVDADIDPAQSRVEIRQSRFQIGKLAVEVAGTLIHPIKREDRDYDLTIKVPKIPCQDLLDSIPSQLIPGLEGFSMAGHYVFDGALRADFSNLDAMELDGLTRGLGMDACRARTAPRRLDPRRLMGDITHRLTLRDGTALMMHLGSGSEHYTPLREIAPEVAAALLTTEDGGFWRHQGFILSQIKAALRRNLEAGGVRLGASTITMQMVKNVFLSHERTLSRKLQEVFLTWYVERVLPKERIMELYLNVIEFGPRVYGVTRAADHYFGKHPIELNSLEAAYLAMMVPSPVRRHEHYCRGKLDRKYETKLRRIHGFMHSRDRITEDDYLMWKDAELMFSDIDRGEPKRCLEEITHLLEATEGQRALSGVLGDDRAGRAPVAIRGWSRRGQKSTWGEERLPGERFKRYHARVGLDLE